jgi:UrcA family protein
MNTQMIASRLLGFKTAIRVAGLISVCLAVPVSALAQQPSVAAQTSSVKVSLVDLDLSTAKGVDMARGRLIDTARRHCAQESGNPEPSHGADFASCMDNTLMNELKQLSSNARVAIEAKGSAWSTFAEDRSGKTETTPETSVVAVSIADLDLSSSEGVRIAQERIHKAVRRICSQLTSSQDPASHYANCMNDATTGALRQIREAALAAN